MQHAQLSRVHTLGLGEVLERECLLKVATVFDDALLLDVACQLVIGLLNYIFAQSLTKEHVLEKSLHFHSLDAQSVKQAFY